MAIALVGDDRASDNVTANFGKLSIALLVGGSVGLIASRAASQMTQMPELVAILHSLVGLAAVAGWLCQLHGARHWPDRR